MKSKFCLASSCLQLDSYGVWKQSYDALKADGAYAAAVPVLCASSDPACLRGRMHQLAALPSHAHAPCPHTTLV